MADKAAERAVAYLGPVMLKTKLAAAITEAYRPFVEATRSLLAQVDNLPHLGPLEGPVAYSAEQVRLHLREVTGE